MRQECIRDVARGDAANGCFLSKGVAKEIDRAAPCLMAILLRYAYEEGRVTLGPNFHRPFNSDRFVRVLVGKAEDP